MIGDGPIRISVHEWVIIRNNRRSPKALIRRVDPESPTEHYRVVTFELDPAERMLLGRYRTLDAANDSVLYDRPVTNVPAHSGYPIGTTYVPPSERKPVVGTPSRNGRSRRR